jgi:hypothetical protein
MRLVRGPFAPDAPSRATRLFGLPFSETGEAYYRAVFGEARTDHSFRLMDGEAVVAAVACDDAGGIIGRFGSPLEPVVAPGQHRAVADLLGELRRIAGALPIRIALRDGADPDGALTSALLKAGATPAVQVRAESDLAQDDAGLMAGLRKGARQGVRWGQAHLALRRIDALDPDADAFDAFRALHAEVAGRVTRPLESWAATLELIRQGRAELVLCSLDGALMGGTLVMDAGDTAHYATGVYRRDHFDKPLAHAPLFAAMAGARGRGRRWFDLGDLTATATDKEAAIAGFKGGFAATARVGVVWTLAP